MKHQFKQTVKKTDGFPSVFCRLTKLKIGTICTIKQVAIFFEIRYNITITENNSACPAGGSYEKTNFVSTFVSFAFIILGRKCVCTRV